MPRSATLSTIVPAGITGGTSPRALPVFLCWTLSLVTLSSCNYAVMPESELHKRFWYVAQSEGYRSLLRNKLPDAEKQYTQAAAEARFLGKDNLRLAESTRALAGILQKQGQHARALSLFIESGSIFQKHLQTSARKQSSYAAAATEDFLAAAACCQSLHDATQHEKWLAQALTSSQILSGNPDWSNLLLRVQTAYIRMLKSQKREQDAIRINSKLIAGQLEAVETAMQKRNLLSAITILDTLVVEGDLTPTQSKAILATTDRIAAICKKDGSPAEAEHIYEVALEATAGTSEIETAWQLLQHCLNNLKQMNLPLKLSGPYTRASKPLSGSTRSLDYARLGLALGQYVAAAGCYRDAQTIYLSALSAVYSSQSDSGSSDLTAALLSQLVKVSNDPKEKQALEAGLSTCLTAARKSEVHNPSAVADSLCQIARAFMQSGNFAAATQRYTEAIALYRRLPHVPSAKLALALRESADNSRLSGDGKAAEPLYKEALATSAGAWTKSDLNYGLTLRGLAEAKRLQGQYLAAEALYDRVLENLLKNKDTSDIDRDPAEVLRLKAECQRLNGQAAESEANYKKAIALWRQEHGNNSPPYFAVLSLAQIYIDQRRYKEAGEQYELAVLALSGAGGDKHPGMPGALFSLGCTLEADGYMKEACQKYERATSLEERTGATKSSDYVRHLCALGRGLSRLKEDERARTVFDRACACVPAVDGAGALLEESAKALSESGQSNLAVHIRRRLKSGAVSP